MQDTAVIIIVLAALAAGALVCWVLTRVRS
jgi:hypothetical protein